MGRRFVDRVIVVLVAAMVVLSGRGGDGAEESAADHLWPRVDSARFAALCAPLNLDRNQRLLVEMLYSDYEMEIEELVAETDAAAERAGRRRLEEALAGRARVEPDEIRRLRVAVLEVYRDMWPAADAALEDLLSGFEAVLIGDQPEVASEGLLNLRRHMLLSPMRADERSGEYAGEGVDLVQLIQRAGRDGNELVGADTEVLEAIVEGHARQLDDVLAEVAIAQREGAMAARIARVKRDARAQRRLEREQIERWRRIYELNEKTANRVAELAATSLGPQARQAWLDRYHDASFPWMYAPTRADRIFQWLNEDDETTAEQRSRAAEFYNTFLPEREKLRQAARDLIIEGRTEHGRPFHPMMSSLSLSSSAGQQLYQKLLRNSGELEAIERSTSARLEALLTDRQRKHLERALRRQRR